MFGMRRREFISAAWRRGGSVADRSVGAAARATAPDRRLRFTNQDQAVY